MCSKQAPEDAAGDEDEVGADLLAIPQEENIDYNDPTVNHSYYEPSIDLYSEFPWHHPENRDENRSHNAPDVNLNEFYNPWDIYRGNIPAHKDDFKNNNENADNYQEMRKYAWDPHQIHQQPESHNYSQNTQNNVHYIQHHDRYLSEHREKNAPKEGAWQSNNGSGSNNYEINKYVDVTHDSQFEHSLGNHHNVPQHHHENINQIHSEKHRQEHNYSEPHHVHEHNSEYISYDGTESKNHTSNQVFGNESQVDYQLCHTHSLQTHDHHVVKKISSSSNLKQQNRPQIYTVMLDHSRVNNHASGKKINGYISDDECDIYEDITPRHPYDGFYLRHRMTIDSRGRKICSHEIPLRPPSLASESSEEFEEALETFEEEITEQALNDEDCQTGVAGNLARVVPGAPLQQEAVDELTRRQGWETGNIDYMGADSFDNIWAKISQTLSQPTDAPKEDTQPEEDIQADSPSQPEPAMPSSDTALITPATESKSVAPASESAAPASEPVVVETPSDKPALIEKEAASPVAVAVTPDEVPAAVETATLEKPAEAADVPQVEATNPVEETAAPAEPAPVDEAPAPAEPAEASGKPEEIIPVPVEAAAASVESDADLKGKTEPDTAEIPVVALDALKIDETITVAKVEATEPESSVPEPTPAPSLASIEVAQAATASDSPPLANTPSKEEIPGAPAAKSEERRKPAGKLQLRPPLAADPALTPDSEAEDAAALAHSIIAGELRTPTVTAPTPPTLSSDTTPPATVSLSQIGIKSKPTTAAQIESSVKSDSAPSTPESPKTEAPKKKIIKKVVKKEKEGASTAEAPVPPPRKKEKKPKEK